VDPKRNDSDRRWHPHVVDLSGYAGQTVTLVFETGTGPAGDYRYDWAGWGEPRLVLSLSKGCWGGRLKLPLVRFLAPISPRFFLRLPSRLEALNPYLPMLFIVNVVRSLLAWKLLRDMPASRGHQEKKDAG
jgi:hypothetical protein